MNREMRVQPADDPALRQVGELFEGYAGSWWVAGGWAVDLNLGRVTRAHGDVDVQVLARELELFVGHSGAYELQLADRLTGERRAWAYPEPVEPGRETLLLVGGPVALEVMVARSDGDEWVFHRGHRTRLPLGRLTRRTADGLPYLAPEVVLLFKARGTRPKDEEDFRALAPLLGPEQRSWLAERLTPPGTGPHPWREALEA
ncbi:nucleotidyltransferase domain-containing protein [Kitasatospora sp. MMS16-BH015]|uniref:nucleotidyltransferase domain-containing protein n=1 Tax=Kitasatospora sp. MMS16-BH015 TaxID=2018025 RepID=UPI00131A5564|nr:amino acid transporter [Kitasatospora sp. MMS16-BH015]